MKLSSNQHEGRVDHEIHKIEQRSQNCRPHDGTIRSLLPAHERENPDAGQDQRRAERVGRDHPDPPDVGE